MASVSEGLSLHVAYMNDLIVMKAGEDMLLIMISLSHATCLATNRHQDAVIVTNAESACNLLCSCSTEENRRSLTPCWKLKAASIFTHHQSISCNWKWCLSEEY